MSNGNGNGRPGGEVDREAETDPFASPDPAQTQAMLERLEEAVASFAMAQRETERQLSDLAGELRGTLEKMAAISNQSHIRAGANLELINKTARSVSADLAARISMLTNNVNVLANHTFLGVLPPDWIDLPGPQTPAVPP
jgi:hypothetical protein